MGVTGKNVRRLSRCHTDDNQSWLRAPTLVIVAIEKINYASIIRAWFRSLFHPGTVLWYLGRNRVRRCRRARDIGLVEHYRAYEYVQVLVLGYGLARFSEIEVVISTGRQNTRASNLLASILVDLTPGFYVCLSLCTTGNGGS